MAQPVIQAAFHAGEWAPSLYARVDLQKYHAAAALMRNFFVDYRGGASTRYGSKYVLQAFKSATKVRLIPFQASFSVNYVLEFGANYIRFHVNGSPVLETAKNITGATQANPCVVTSNAHGFLVGDWVFITGVGGMTQLNGKFFQIIAVTANTFSLGKILDGSNVNSSAFGAYTAGGTAARVFTLASPYAAADLGTISFAQNVNTLVLCHQGYVPYVLTIISATNWTLTAIAFGSTLPTPAAPTITTTLGGAGPAFYAYVVTAVDANGQESAPSGFGTLANKADMRIAASNTTTITWVPVPGGISFNVYKAQISYAAALPAGSQLGFIGNGTGTSIVDSNIEPDFSLTPPTVENPFLGAGVASYTVTAAGAYTTVPTVTVAAPTSGSTATATAVLGAITITAIVAGGTGYSAGQIVSMGTAFAGASLMTITVLTVDGGGRVLTASIQYQGSIQFGSTPANPLVDVAKGVNFVSINLTWGVIAVNAISQGSGYTAVPAVTFSAGAAAATAVLGAASSGNPSVACYFQQRLVLAAPPGAVNTFYMSQPGSYYNFNITDPVVADNAITGSIVGTRLNTIKYMLPLVSGLLVMTDQQAWIVNGGSQGVVVTALNASSQGHGYNGIDSVPPIIINYDVLYVQAKGSIVRDLAYNFYTNTYAGSDISVLSSHLFFSFQLTEWAHAEEPYKIIWAVRSDGAMLSLTFLKDQELIGWAHHDTNGLYKSVCSVVETITQGSVDAVYTVVQRVVNGNTVQYIERFADRYPAHYNDTSVWCVDAGLQYNGAPATVFSGLDHLVGMTVTGLADGAVIPNTVVAADGSVTLAQAASVVTIGLAYTPQLGTLPLDLGEPTAQGKRKTVRGLTARVKDALGLNCGRLLTNQIPMKDLVLGNVGTMSNAQVTDLVTSDVRTIVDPQWDVFGTYFITQPNPYPATVLGVIPEIAVGDTP